MKRYKRFKFSMEPCAGGAWVRYAAVGEECDRAWVEAEQDRGAKEEVYKDNERYIKQIIEVREANKALAAEVETLKAALKEIDLKGGRDSDFYKGIARRALRLET